jgi:hypothetical protein
VGKAVGMTRRLAIAILVIVVALPAVIAASASSDTGSARTMFVAKGCPAPSDENPSQGLAEHAIAAAQAVVIDHKVAHVQGRTYRRNTANTPLLQVVKLGEVPLLPGQQVLQRVAARRCGKETARWSFALVFGDQATVMCCIRTIVFAVHVKRGWRVY